MDDFFQVEKKTNKKTVVLLLMSFSNNTGKNIFYQCGLRPVKLLLK